MAVFDNSNLNESYAGVVSPLTRSFIERVYSQVYQQFCALMGVARSDIKKNKSIFDNLLGYIGGHMYYNLSNWHKMFALMPGYSFNGKFLEQMMGIPEEQQGKVHEEKVVSTFKIIYLFLRIILIFVFMDKLIKKFNNLFQLKYKITLDTLNKIKAEKIAFNYLVGEYLNLEKEFTKDFSVPIANDMAVMISSGLLKKLYTKWFGERGKLIANNLIGGNSGLKSSEPGKLLKKIIISIQNDKGVYNYLLTHTSKQNILFLNMPRNRKIAKLLNNYKLKFGSRIPGELKLESIKFTDNPEALISLVTKNLHFGVDNFFNSRRVIKNERANIIQKIILGFLQKWMQKSVKYREITRFQRTLIFDVARKLFNKIGKNLTINNRLNRQRDIFYLTIDDLLKNTNNYKLLVMRNKKRANFYNKLNMPNRIVTETISLNLDQFKNKKTINPTRLGGTTASYGKYGNKVTAKAIVIKNFDPYLNYSGKILVTQQTDPGWTIIFPFLKGIVIERGGLLSHASIVSREFNIPCIIGVPNATGVIKNGQKITMDLEEQSVY